MVKKLWQNAATLAALFLASGGGKQAAAYPNPLAGQKTGVSGVVEKDDTTNAELDAAIKAGSLIPCKKEDLREESYRRCEKLVHQAGFADVPDIFLCATISGSLPPIQVGATQEGRRAVLVDIRQVTDAYLRNLIMKGNSYIDDKVKDGSWVSADAYLSNLPADKDHDRITDEIHRLTASCRDMAGRMGISPAPDIYIAVNSDEGGPAESMETREGRRIVILQADFVENTWPFADKESVVGHELTHLRNKDMEPQKLILSLNPSYSQQEEKRADLIGAGALGSDNPRALSDYFKNTLALDILLYGMGHADGSDTPSADPVDDFRKAITWINKQDTAHPPLTDRIRALRKEAWLMEEVANPDRLPFVGRLADIRHQTHERLTQERTAEIMADAVLNDSGNRIPLVPAVDGLEKILDTLAIPQVRPAATSKRRFFACNK